MKKKVLLITLLLVVLIVAAIPVIALGTSGDAPRIAEPQRTAVPCDGNLQSVIDTYVFNEANYIRLDSNIDAAITINKPVYLDLNGKTVAGTITIEGNGELYVMDTATDGYTNETWGKITAEVNGELKAVPEGSYVSAVEPNSNAYRAGYLMIQEKDGVSFHRVGLDLTAVYFNPSNLSMAYQSNFSGDKAIKSVLKAYGVALRIGDAPGENNVKDCPRSTLDLNTFAVGQNVGKSTYLVNIMRDSNSAVTNKANAETQVFARAYILIEDEGGERFFLGEKANKSLYDTVLAAEEQFEGAGDNLRKATVEMYQKFESVMRNWELPEIQSAAEEAKQQEEDDVLKILMIGNSHGVDATKLLNEVFKKAAPNQKVVIGALYHSGCRIDQHMDYITNNAGQYIYYKIDSSRTTWTRLPESKRDENKNVILGELDNGDILGGVTLDYGLKDEQWDIITLQQMSTWAAYDKGTYNFDQLSELVDYVLDNATGNPKLYWNATWTAPNDDIRVATYQGAGYGSNWYKNHVAFFGLSQREMYRQIVSNIQEDVLYEGHKFAGIIDTVTAVQYMQDAMGLTEYQVYRDGTHLSDYGRLMVAYLWYSTFTGDRLELADICETIEEKLATGYGNKDNVSYPVDRNLTVKMREDIITAVHYALDNPLEMPDDVVEAERITYADTKDGVWVCGNVIADLKSTKKVGDIPVKKVTTAKDNTVTIELGNGFGNVVLSRESESTMRVTSVSANVAAAGITVGSVFTYQAN